MRFAEDAWSSIGVAPFIARHPLSVITTSQGVAMPRPADRFTHRLPIFGGDFCAPIRSISTASASICPSESVLRSLTWITWPSASTTSTRPPVLAG